MGAGIKINSFHPLQKTPSADYQVKQEAKLRKAAQMYESQFLNTLVGQMRKTVPESGLVKKSYAENLFKNKLDQEYVDVWTKKGGIGLADMIYEQMHGKIFGQQFRGSKPQGPLPTSKSKLHPLHQKTPPKFLIQKNEIEGPAGGVNIHLKKDPEAIKEKMTLSSPWQGEISEVTKMDDELKVIKIVHDNGVKSILGFQGGIEDLSPGQKLSAGQELGYLNASASGLSWGLRLKS